VSNSVLSLAQNDGLVWAGLLNPQGKYLADFFIGSLEGQIFCDFDAEQVDATLKRLNMYRLRADVQFSHSDWGVVCGVAKYPQGAQPDPRHKAMGWRLYGHAATLPEPADIDWDELRVRYGIPKAGIELIENDSYLLEMGFERLQGLDFRKGCYVGQEVTARMKHRANLRKSLVRVALSGPVPIGSVIEVDGKEVGRVFTQSGGFALAYVRLDRAGKMMQAAGQNVTLASPPET
jgi:folate-binding protein YgfZ